MFKVLGRTQGIDNGTFIAFNGFIRLVCLLLANHCWHLATCTHFATPPYFSPPFFSLTMNHLALKNYIHIHACQLIHRDLTKKAPEGKGPTREGKLVGFLPVRLKCISCMTHPFPVLSCTMSDELY